ncbi:MAG TPA: zinc ribbon domain-containing protein [Gemmatimonadaceae bacterium]|nr:zinc ribbon domain-containing protein [Gemmatimonadaceae bacterium]
MSDLDRLFRRLVFNIRHGAPQYLGQPFEVAELYQRLVPYRHNRRELEIDTNDDYEQALCQLLAGEGGYLLTEEVMRETLRQELSSPNPHTGIFREFAATRVQLAPEALARLEGAGAGGSSAAAAASSVSAVFAPARPAPAGAGASAPTAAAPAASAGWATRSVSAARQADPPPRSATAPSASHNATAGSPGGGTQASGAGAGAPHASGGSTCRYCGGALPAGRRALFCPNCGQNLMVQRCPACGTELEINWKFCITCGRGIAST